MAPPPSPLVLLDWRVPYVLFSAMICVSVVSSPPPLGLRAPRRALVPSPEAIANGATSSASTKALASTYLPWREPVVVVRGARSLRMCLPFRFASQQPATRAGGPGCAAGSEAYAPARLR